MVRVKYRYMVTQVWWQTQHDGAVPAVPAAAAVNGSHIVKSIRRSVALNFGEFGAGCVNKAIGVQHWDHSTGIFIVRSPREQEKLVHAAMSFMANVGGDDPCTLQVLHSSATLRKATQFIIRHQQERIRASTRTAEPVAAVPVVDPV